MLLHENRDSVCLVQWYVPCTQKCLVHSGSPMNACWVDEWIIYSSRGKRWWWLDPCKRNLESNRFFVHRINSTDKGLNSSRWGQIIKQGWLPGFWIEKCLYLQCLASSLTHSRCLKNVCYVSELTWAWTSIDSISSYEIDKHLWAFWTWFFPNSCPLLTPDGHITSQWLNSTSRSCWGAACWTLLARRETQKSMIMIAII